MDEDFQSKDNQPYLLLLRNLAIYNTLLAQEKCFRLVDYRDINLSFQQADELAFSVQKLMMELGDLEPWFLSFRSDREKVNLNNSPVG